MIGSHPPIRIKSHILVVDDDDLVRKLVETLLLMKGFSVTLAASGEEALEWCDSNGQPDLLLTDVQMPGIHGPELYEKLHHQFPKMPVVFMSGYVGKCSDFKYRPLLNKPFCSRELVSAVNAALLTKRMLGAEVRYISSGE
jgi:two-component system cell cycle sensor histidine kinase/response regulator CckA